jgi:hypothetical protein
MSAKANISVLGLIYLIVGVVVAVAKHYITIAVLKVIASAILAVLLWWLVLLGVNLRLH